MQTVTSISGGKTSAYMAINYPTDHYIFSAVLTEDQGTAPKDKAILRECQNRIPGFIGSTELELTFKNLLEIEQMIGKKITWISAKESQGKPGLQSDKGWLPKNLTFDRLIEYKKALPNRRQRWCTQVLKVEAIFWHTYLNILESKYDVVLMNIGYRADESHRVAKMQDCTMHTSFFPELCNLRGKKQAWAKHEWRVPMFPLHEQGIIKKDVISYWANKSLKWPTVSNCALCFWHSDQELLHNEARYPAQANWAINQEIKTGHSWDKRTVKNRLKFSQPELFDPQEFKCLCTD